MIRPRMVVSTPAMGVPGALLHGTLHLTRNGPCAPHGVFRLVVPKLPFWRQHLNLPFYSLAVLADPAVLKSIAEPAGPDHTPHPAASTPRGARVSKTISARICRCSAAPQDSAFGRSRAAVRISGLIRKAASSGSFRHRAFNQCADLRRSSGAETAQASANSSATSRLPINNMVAYRTDEQNHGPA